MQSFDWERLMRSATLFAALIAAGALSACDRSPQNADGATKTGDAGNATATGNGTVADTGHDNGSADIGGAGQAAEPGGATTAGGATSPKSQ